MKKSNFVDSIYYIIFLIFKFFILVGEITQKIILFPFRSILFIIKKLIFLLEKVLFLINFKRIKNKFSLKKVLKKKIPFFFLNAIKKLFIWVIKNISFFLKIINRFSKQIKRFFKSFFPIKLRFFFLGVITTLVIVFLIQSYFFVKNLPSPLNIGKINFALSTHLYDRNGILLYEIYRDQNRTPININELPVYVTQATIAIEDKDFYRHKGVAFFSGILRAIRDTFIYKQLQGGSTITQQLVKSALLTPDKTIERKLKEIILALWAEQIYSKEEILQMYFNQVPYGGTAYGIEEAAKTYFGKSAKDLNLIEAATLAGLPQAPSLYSPYSNPQLALKRRNDVLLAMKNQNYINKETYEKAIKEPLVVKPIESKIYAPHFVFYVKAKLEDLYGISKVETGGLNVLTTLDLNIQKECEKILKEELEKVKNLNVTNGAILVTRPSTGEILAMVGSVDYFALPSGAFNVTIGLRQPGSAIKPIMYALALQKGFTAATIIDDSPIVFKIPGSLPYAPVNYDGRFHGKIPLRYALANSYNVPAVKVLSTIGVEDFINFASKMGITSWQEKNRYGLSITLGGAEVTMLDMATAFGVLANGGYKVLPNSIIKVEDFNQEKLYELTYFKIKELDPGMAFIISDILSDNIARRWAFGIRSALEIPGYKVAVKTGTTDNKKDNWTIGYTPEFLVAVWVGNNDGTPMNPYLTSGITGAAPIWNRVMTYLLKNYGSGKWYEKPENIVEKTCYFGRKEYFIKGTENKVSCQSSLFNQTPTPTP